MAQAWWIRAEHGLDQGRRLGSIDSSTGFGHKATPGDASALRRRHYLEHGFIGHAAGAQGPQFGLRRLGGRFAQVLGRRFAAHRALVSPELAGGIEGDRLRCGRRWQLLRRGARQIEPDGVRNGGCWARTAWLPGSLRAVCGVTCIESRFRGDDSVVTPLGCRVNRVGCRRCRSSDVNARGGKRHGLAPRGRAEWRVLCWDSLG